jgi:hypothetical protein
VIRPRRHPPPAELIAEVEERMGEWANEVGVWWLFQVMTVVAQVMKLVREADPLDGTAP